MKPVVARFDAEHASTDGGALLLKALDERLTLTENVAACLPDRRDPRKVQHARRDLLRQRVFGLACGYEDGHDAARGRRHGPGCPHDGPCRSAGRTERLAPA